MPRATDLDAYGLLATVCEDGARWVEKARNKADIAEMSAALGSLHIEHQVVARDLMRASQRLGGQADPSGSVGGAVERLALEVKTKLADDEQAVVEESLSGLREKTLAAFDEALERELTDEARGFIGEQRTRLERAYAPIELIIDAAD